MTAKTKAEIQAELDATKAELETLRASVKEKVLDYPDGCLDGKIDFLKSVGITDVKRHKSGGTMTVMLEVQWFVDDDDAYDATEDDVYDHLISNYYDSFDLGVYGGPNGYYIANIDAVQVSVNIEPEDEDDDY